MNLWALAAGVLCGLGIFVAVREIVPAPIRLDAALARLDPGQDWVPSAAPRAPRPPGGWRGASPRSCPGCRYPRPTWPCWGRTGRAGSPARSPAACSGWCSRRCSAALAMLAGTSLPWTFSVVASLVFGAALFFAPDLVTRVNAAERRDDFRHALTSYLDLVALERGAGAGPTEALEAAAEIGDGWAFQRISGALAAARRSGAAPWTALARAGPRDRDQRARGRGRHRRGGGSRGSQDPGNPHRAGRLDARPGAGQRPGQGGSRSTTMVVPIALLGAGFLLLLIFPIVYRTFGPDRPPRREVPMDPMWLAVRYLLDLPVIAPARRSTGIRSPARSRWSGS